MSGEIMLVSGSFNFKNKTSQSKIDKCKEDLDKKAIFYATDYAIFCSLLLEWLSEEDVIKGFNKVWEYIGSRVSGRFLALKGDNGKDKMIMTMDKDGIDIKRCDWDWRLNYKFNLSDEATPGPLCMAIGEGAVYWRNTPSEKKINELNKILKENNLFVADKHGIRTTIYQWGDWGETKEELKTIAEYIRHHHCPVVGGFYFMRGKESHGEYIPTSIFGEKWSLRGGSVKKSVKGRVGAARKVHRKKK
ncbi:hypothetical protein M9Y10_015764 [Tritrichomonas musculus]|uniref:Uncharacterized protein n=1 Tax=Tritrichomonas musculus TaxID=1915356 RepID=A0ABR2I7H2_9EUKA